MARPETLVPGNCYFSVGFYDREMRLPMIDTLVFVKVDHDADGPRRWIFADPRERPSPTTPPATRSRSGGGPSPTSSCAAFSTSRR